MSDTLPRAKLLPRIAAALYDLLLLIGVEFAAFLPVAALRAGTEATGQYHPLLTAYVLLVAFLFFAWFWTHGGQTLGMRAWRMRIRSLDGTPVSWVQASKRFAVACLSWPLLGLGVLWILWDKEKLSWHDRVSGTELVVEPKK